MHVWRLRLQDYVVKLLAEQRQQYAENITAEAAKRRALMQYVQNLEVRYRCTFAAKQRHTCDAYWNATADLMQHTARGLLSRIPSATICAAAYHKQAPMHAWPASTSWAVCATACCMLPKNRSRRSAAPQYLRRVSKCSMHGLAQNQKRELETRFIVEAKLGG